MSDRHDRSAPPPIVLDCDPGHDDAIAIVVAARHTELLGITTVAGNAPLERTTYNACVVRDLLGLDVEIHSGAQRPLVAPPMHAGYVHGESGLDGADLPVPARGAQGGDAVSFIIDTCRSRPGTWLVATGPLTNVALALRAAPELRHHVAGVSLMGGGTFGNRSPVAEFNIWADPEAASIVFGAGVPLLMCGLDVTHTFVATPERVDMVRALPGRLPAVLTDLLEFFSRSYVARHADMRGAAVHDPLAVLALTHPHLVSTTPHHVDVETHGSLTRGMTVIDRRTLVDRPAANCTVVEGLDVEGAWSVVIGSIASFTG
jgi:inosine-uridine nucleoside N-ribohydrolase